MSDAIANVSGRDLFASTRREWHGKGVLARPDITSAEEFLSLTGLDQRTVTVEPVYLPRQPRPITAGPGAQNEDENALFGLCNVEHIPGDLGDAYGAWCDCVVYPVEGQNTTVSRWNDGTVNTYSAAGNRYGIMSDRDAFGLWDGFNFQAGGALYDARKVWATVAVDRETVLDPSGVADRIKMHGLVVNSHDGTAPLLFAATPVRVVCQNTLNMAMGSLSNVVKVRHTKTVSERAQVLAEIMKRENAYFDAFEQEAKALYAASFSDKQYSNAVETMIGKAPETNTKGALTKYENKRDLFMQAWKGTPNAGIRGTAWGAVNAMTEANQYGLNVRDGQRGADSALAKTLGLDGPTNTFRQDALVLVKARAGIK